MAILFPLDEALNSRLTNIGTECQFIGGVEYADQERHEVVYLDYKGARYYFGELAEVRNLTEVAIHERLEKLLGTPTDPALPVVKPEGAE